MDPSLSSSRTQCFSVNGVLSKSADNTSVIQQGSVLGPVLFLLYINDISDCISSNIHLFADDSILYHQINSPQDHQILQDFFHKLCIWPNNFNITKCYLMTITTKSKPNISQYQMLSDPLTRVKPTQYFGVTVNSRLIWSDHIHNVTVKAGKALGYAKIYS